MNDVDKKHQENLRNFDKIEKQFADHELKDIARFAEITETLRVLREDLQPVVKAFKDNEIEHIYFDKKRRTVVMYAKDITVVASAVAVIGALIKYFLLSK